jgi:hypothetical protein
MVNDVTRPSGAAPRDPYAEYADEVSTRPFAGDLLRFTKHGQYKAGQEQDVLDTGTRMFVFMPGLKRGWVKWGEGQPLTHIMGLVSESFRPPPREELGDLNEDEWETLNDRPIDPWQTTNYLPMCNTRGEIFTFVTSSKGGLSEIGKLSDMFAGRRRMKPDEIPVIELQARSYDHKDYGETFAPVFKVIGWVPVPSTFTELTAAVDDGSDETLVLEDLMDPEPDEEQEQEQEQEQPAPQARSTQKPAPQKPTQRTAPQKPQKPTQRTAPQKPAQKTATKPPPSRGGKAGNGRRSPRL